MPRVHQRVAAKNYPESGIKKGDTYFYTKIRQQRGGIVKRSLTPFKRSQLTTSAFLSQMYDIEDRMAQADDVDTLTEIAEALRELGSETREKFDAMPEGLQQGDTGQILEERAQNCESAADEIDEALRQFTDEWDEEPTEDTYDQEEHGSLDDALMAYEDARDRAVDAAKEVSVEY